jgi:hypothetical protein
LPAGNSQSLYPVGEDKEPLGCKPSSIGRTGPRTKARYCEECREQNFNQERLGTHISSERSIFNLTTDLQMIWFALSPLENCIDHAVNIRECDFSKVHSVVEQTASAWLELVTVT